MYRRIREFIIWGISAFAILSSIALIALQGNAATHIFFGFCSMTIGLMAMVTLYYLNRNSKDIYTFSLMVASIATWLSIYIHLLFDLGYLTFLNYSGQAGLQIQYVVRIAQSFVIIEYLVLRSREDRIWLMQPVTIFVMLLCYFLIYLGAFPALIDDASNPTFLALSFNFMQLFSIAGLLAALLGKRFLRPYLASFAIGGVLLITGGVVSLVSLRASSPNYHILESLSYMFAYLSFYIGFTVPAIRGNLEMGIMPLLADRSSLIAALAHPAFITDTDMLIIAANKESEKWLKKSRMDLIGQTIYHILPEAEHLLKDMVSESRMTLRESTRQTQRLAGRHVSFTLYPSINPDNQATRFTFVGWDVSGEVKAEQNLERSERTYRSLFLHTGTGFMLYRLPVGSSNKEMELIDVNPAFERNTGEKGPFQLGGKLRENTSFLNAGWYDMILRAALDKRSVVIDGFSSGAQRWLYISAFPVTEETFGMVIADQTALRNFQREISASELKYRSLVESMPMCVLSLDSGYRITYVNDSLREMAELGSPEQYLGKALDEVFSEDYVQFFRKMRSEVDGKDATHSEELELIRNERKRWQRWIAKAVIDKGETMGYICLGQDITEQKEAAISMSLSEERFRTLFMDNYLPMLIVEADRYSVLMANKASQSFYGLSEQDLQGRTIISFSPPESSGSIEAMAGSAKDSGFGSMLTRQLASGGLVKDVELFASTLFLADKMVLSFTVNDISERRQMEDKLERERAYLDSLFENNPDAVVVIDSDIRITRANIAFRKLFGFSRSSIIGKTLSGLIGTELTAQDIESNIVKSIEGSKLDFTARRQRADGSIIPVRVICIPLTLPDGSRYVYAIYHDMSELAQSQQMLGLANEVIKESPAVLIKWSNQVDWSIEYVSSNVSRWGYSPDDLLGRKLMFTELVHEEDLANLTREADEYMQKGMSEYVQEYRLRMANGDFIWVEDHTKIVRATDGSIEGIQGVIIDNTEKKLAEIERLRTHEELKLAWNRSLDVLSSVTEFKDPYTAGHQRGVAEIAESIARQMGLSNGRVEAISKSALVHDIGKLHIPADILNRPRTLTPLEYKLVQMHCKSGRDILSNIKLPWPLAEIVFQHHERIDGNGYPRGLKGDEILLEAKIIAVSDIVDAMTSHRPYRPASSLPEALEEVLALRGTALDPDVVDACIAVFKDRGIEAIQPRS